MKSKDVLHFMLFSHNSLEPAWFSLNVTPKTSDPIPSHSGSYHTALSTFSAYIGTSGQANCCYLTSKSCFCYGISKINQSINQSIKIYFCGVYCSHEFLIWHTEVGKSKYFSSGFLHELAPSSLFLTMTSHSSHALHNDKDSQTTHLLCLFLCPILF